MQYIGIDGRLKTAQLHSRLVYADGQPVEPDPYLNPGLGDAIQRGQAHPSTFDLVGGGASPYSGKVRKHKAKKRKLSKKKKKTKRRRTKRR